MLMRPQSVPFPKLPPLLKLPPLPRLLLPKLPPLHDVREAVQRDMRGLWSGMEALRFHDLPAANDPSFAAEPSFAPELSVAAPVVAWRPPLGWISLAAAGVLFAALGFAQMEVQRRLSPSVQQTQQQRPATRKHKKLRRVRTPERTDYSRGT